MGPVAITGVGLVTALGVGSHACFEALCRGERGLVTRPDFSQAGGPVASVRAEASVFGEEAAERGWLTSEDMAVVAAREAVAGLGDRSSLAVVGATTTASLRLGEIAFRENLTGRRPTHPGHFLWRQLCGRPAAVVHRALGAGGTRLSLSAACVSGASAVGAAWDLVRSGRAPAALAVGADSLCATVYFGFGSLGVHSPTGCRPFDAERDGMSIGEGAGALLLEPLDRAVARGASILAVVGGYASGADAHHLTAPDPEGRGASAVIERVLGAGGADDVGWVCAHGTGTQLNDLMEAKALTRTLPGVPVSGVKGAIGHTLGAAGSIEAAIAVLSLAQQRIPPTAGLRALDFDLDAVRRERLCAFTGVVSTNFAFGGTNTALSFSTEAR